MCGPSNAGALPANTLEITVLADGRIKIETGDFAGPTHASAEAAIPAIAQALGVSITDVRKRIVHGHVHNHATTTTTNTVKI